MLGNEFLDFFSCYYFFCESTTFESLTNSMTYSTVNMHAVSPSKLNAVNGTS